tara:strand:- start:969 stop:1661 length:693 start_codon:yes stop_codon:yes gene_type:complete
MNFNTVDLQAELERIKRKSKVDILDEVQDILNHEIEKEAIISEKIQGKQEGQPDIDWSKLNPQSIYNLEQIKKICVKYRLRFLDSKAFIGEIPAEAILKVKALEKELGHPIDGFKIVAPKKLFQLEDKDSDPLLFLQLSDNKFYFIHKWGGELNKFRSLLAAPLRSFMSLFWTLIGVAFLFALAIPTTSIDVFMFLFVHSFIALCGITCMIIFMIRENFSDVEWNSKFFS